MNFLRSIFIAAFPAYLLAASLYALTQLVRGAEPILAWLGLALSALGPLSFFVWVMLAKPARTVRHPVEISVVSALGLAIAMTVAWRFGDTAGSVHAWAGISVLSWVFYLRWYSPFRGRSAPALEIGNTLPEFSLRNAAGATVNSSLFRGRKHILLFYRGNWCPFCTAQIRELAGHYRELEAAGATVVLISPQPLGKHREIARRFEVPMQFLQDPGNEAARSLGINAPWGTPMGLQLLGYASNTVLPTVLITDEQGRIIYSHLTDNYRVRPEPGEFLAAIDDPAA